MLPDAETVLSTAAVVDTIKTVMVQDLVSLTSGDTLQPMFRAIGSGGTSNASPSNQFSIIAAGA